MLRAAIREFALAVHREDPDAIGIRSDLVRWIGGEKLGVSQRKRLRNPEPIDASNAGPMLQGILAFLRAQGCAGFLLLLDEAEAITSLQRMADRSAANENIRAIIDGAARTPGFYFVFATTPSFLDPSEPRSAATYQALWRRISNPLGAAGNSLERTIIELPALTEEQFAELASRIRAIVELARGQEATGVSDEDLGALSAYVRQRRSDEVSTLVRSVVVLVGQAIDDPEFDFGSTYPFVVEEQIQEIERQLTQD
jgi:hypothetical protein